MLSEQLNFQGKRCLDCNYYVRSSAAKRSTNNRYVCKYIGRIVDQSNWSGPFSLVVMTLDYRSGGTWFDLRSWLNGNIFFTGLFLLLLHLLLRFTEIPVLNATSVVPECIDQTESLPEYSDTLMSYRTYPS